MNKNQKEALIFCLILFITSLIWVPSEINLSASSDPQTIFKGFVLIGSDFETEGSEISIKVLLLEWFALAIFFTALFFLFKDKEK